MNPFEFVNAINSVKKPNLMVGTENDELAEKSYVPFVVNRALSYFPDTILTANEMNLHNNIDSSLQYYFYLNTIKPRKRFAKWAKKVESDDFNAVQQYYGYNNQKTVEALPLLSDKQLNLIKLKLQFVTTLLLSEVDEPNTIA
jgi:hypothetical protein